MTRYPLLQTVSEFMTSLCGFLKFNDMNLDISLFISKYNCEKNKNIHSITSIANFI